MNEYPRQKTRDGQEVIVYNTDGGGDYPLHGAWWDGAEQRWIPHAWSKDGYVIDKKNERALDVIIKKEAGNKEGTE
mgnify:CR=1 FL=1